MGMTQKELGQELGRSERTIQRYESEDVFMGKVFYNAVFLLHSNHTEGKTDV